MFPQLAATVVDTTTAAAWARCGRRIIIAGTCPSHRRRHRPGRKRLATRTRSRATRWSTRSAIRPTCSSPTTARWSRRRSAAPPSSRAPPSSWARPPWVRAFHTGGVRYTRDGWRVRACFPPKRGPFLRNRTPTTARRLGYFFGIWNCMLSYVVL